MKVLFLFFLISLSEVTPVTGETTPVDLREVVTSLETSLRELSRQFDEAQTSLAKANLKLDEAKLREGSCFELFSTCSRNVYNCTDAVYRFGARFESTFKTVEMLKEVVSQLRNSSSVTHGLPEPAMALIRGINNNITVLEALSERVLSQLSTSTNETRGFCESEITRKENEIVELEEELDEKKKEIEEKVDKIKALEALTYAPRKDRFMLNIRLVFGLFCVTFVGCLYGLCTTPRRNFFQHMYAERKASLFASIFSVAFTLLLADYFIQNPMGLLPGLNPVIAIALWVWNLLTWLLPEGWVRTSAQADPHATGDVLYFNFAYAYASAVLCLNVWIIRTECLAARALDGEPVRCTVEDKTTSKYFIVRTIVFAVFGATTNLWVPALIPYFFFLSSYRAAFNNTVYDHVRFNLLRTSFKIREDEIAKFEEFMTAGWDAYRKGRAVPPFGAVQLHQAHGSANNGGSSSKDVEPIPESQYDD